MDCEGCEITPRDENTCVICKDVYELKDEIDRLKMENIKLRIEIRELKTKTEPYPHMVADLQRLAKVDPATSAILDRITYCRESWANGLAFLVLCSIPQLRIMLDAKAKENVTDPLKAKYPPPLKSQLTKEGDVSKRKISDEKQDDE